MFIMHATQQVSGFARVLSMCIGLILEGLTKAMLAMAVGQRHPHITTAMRHTGKQFHNPYPWEDASEILSTMET